MKVINTTSNLHCDDAIKCIFNLNNLDIKVLNKLKELKKARASEIAKQIKKERSTVYRSLQKLMSCGICIKKKMLLEKGGYYHLYFFSENANVKKNAMKCLDDWYISMKSIIQQFDD